RRSPSQCPSSRLTPARASRAKKSAALFQYRIGSTALPLPAPRAVAPRPAACSTRRRPGTRLLRRGGSARRFRSSPRGSRPGMATVHDGVMTRALSWSVLAVIVLAAACKSSEAGPPRPPDAPEPPRITPPEEVFEIEELGRFEEAWAMTFLPDGRLLI